MAGIVRIILLLFLIIYIAKQARLIVGTITLVTFQFCGNSDPSVGPSADDPSVGPSADDPSVGPSVDDPSPEPSPDPSPSEPPSKYEIGSYPQTKVTDDALINTLNSKVYPKPSAEWKGAWKDYGYYSKGVVSSYSWYIDSTYNGVKYRAVYFDKYRPDYTTSAASSEMTSSRQKNNGYPWGIIYWFKYEPVTWKVLFRSENKVLLLSNVILDCQQFYHLKDDRTIDGKKVYSNNYKESDIRTWINNNFYNTVFTADEKANILTTEVDNSSEQSYNPFNYENKYSCENTNDKMFLLSTKEIQTTEYGFPNNGLSSPTRKFGSTDYANAQGSLTTYYLRTPNADDTVPGCVGYVNKEGMTRSVNNPAGTYISSYAVPTEIYTGTLPAMWVTL